MRGLPCSSPSFDRRGGWWWGSLQNGRCDDYLWRSGSHPLQVIVTKTTPTPSWSTAAHSTTTCSFPYLCIDSTLSELAVWLLVLVPWKPLQGTRSPSSSNKSIFHFLVILIFIFSNYFDLIFLHFSFLLQTSSSNGPGQRSATSDPSAETARLLRQSQSESSAAD